MRLYGIRRRVTGTDPGFHLDTTTQNVALTSLEKGEVPLRPELSDFLKLLLQTTKEGLIADPMFGGNHQKVDRGHIGFPGARPSFLE